MKRLPEKCIDSVVTDPPYGVGLVARTTKSSRSEAATKYQDDADFIRSTIVPRVKYAIAHCSVAMITSGTRNMFAYPEPQELGCVFFPNGAGPSRWGFGTFNPILFYGKDPYLVKGLGGRPTGVIATQVAVEKTDHPCPKPLKWMEWMVERCSFEGQMILDPFCGSGTTLMAAKKLGRHFIGFELDEKYCKIARERVARTEPRPSMKKQGSNFEYFNVLED